MTDKLSPMKRINILSFASMLVVLIIGCGNTSYNQSKTEMEKTDISGTDTTKQVIYFAGGCFWGTEHFFKQVKGVTATEVGYANGHTKNPTYQDVVYKNTGFAETVKVTYDPKQVQLNLLLELFFKTIDPTSINRQGNDVGTQYRSGVYYTSEDQLPAIQEMMREVAKNYDQPLAVEVKPLQNFYTAEEYHQNYLDKNPGGYCHINPALFETAKKANR